MGIVHRHLGKNRLLGSDRLILSRAQNDTLFPPDGRGRRLGGSEERGLPCGRLCELPSLAGDPVGPLSRLICCAFQHHLFSTASRAGSSGELGIACSRLLDGRFWVICIYQNHWTIIFVYYFVV